MAKTHNLKLIDPFFTKSWNEEKNFELRLNDRDFKVGEYVLLREYNPITNTYSGREILVKITFVLTDYVGLTEGYCIFNFITVRCYD